MNKKTNKDLLSDFTKVVLEGRSEKSLILDKMYKLTPKEVTSNLTHLANNFLDKDVSSKEEAVDMAMVMATLYYSTKEQLTEDEIFEALKEIHEYINLKEM